MVPPMPEHHDGHCTYVNLLFGLESETDEEEEERERPADATAGSWSLPAAGVRVMESNDQGAAVAVYDGQEQADQQENILSVQQLVDSMLGVVSDEAPISAGPSVLAGDRGMAAAALGDAMGSPLIGSAAAAAALDKSLCIDDSLDVVVCTTGSDAADQHVTPAPPMHVARAIGCDNEEGAAPPLPPAPDYPPAAPPRPWAAAPQTPLPAQHLPPQQPSYALRQRHTALESAAGAEGRRHHRPPPLQLLPWQRQLCRRGSRQAPAGLLRYMLD